MYVILGFQILVQQNYILLCKVSNVFNPLSYTDCKIICLTFK